MKAKQIIQACSAITSDAITSAMRTVATFALSLLVLSPVMAGIDYQQKADELLPVDCLLPGAVRKLGGQMTYVTQRRPVKTTGVDCEIRGGEYVLYDRASYSTALAIWMPMAQSGDPKAQNLVGEIYEKGLGVQPDYALAAEWYLKAAEQNYSAAQTNLGQLYERGLGVEYSKEKALAWYRKSANIKGKVLKFVNFDYSDEKIAAMERQLNENEQQASLQRQRIAQLAKELDQSNSQKRRAEQQQPPPQQKQQQEEEEAEDEEDEEDEDKQQQPPPRQHQRQNLHLKIVPYLLVLRCVMVIVGSTV